MSDSLWPHGLQHARPPCLSPTPGVYSNSCPLSWWCHPTNSSSVVPFSSHLQSFPASGSFLMSLFFLHIRWPKYWSFSFSVSPSNEYSGLIYLMPNLSLLWFSSWDYPKEMHVHTHTQTNVSQYWYQGPNKDQRSAGEHSETILFVPLVSELHLYFSHGDKFISLWLPWVTTHSAKLWPLFWRWYNLLNTQISFYTIGS